MKELFDLNLGGLVNSRRVERGARGGYLREEWEGNVRTWQQKNSAKYGKNMGKF